MTDTEKPELDEELGEKLDSVLEETAEEAESKLLEDAATKLAEASKKKPRKTKKKKAAAPKEDDPHAEVDMLLREMAKKSGVIMGRASTAEMDKILRYERSPFGMPNLNALFSHSGRPEDGGAPHGRFIVLNGAEGSCKTTLAMDCIARRLTSHEDEYALILDAENAVDPDWAAHFGVPLERVIIIPGTLPLEDMATQGVRILRLFRERGIKISMCLVDSLGAMAPAIELEGKKSGKTVTEVDLRTDHVATSARKINQMLRVWLPEILKSNTCCFLIAHMMTDIGGYGGKVMKGGLGLRYFAHFILNLGRKNDPVFEKEIICRDGEKRKVRTGYFVQAKLQKARSPFDGHMVALPFVNGVGFQTTMALFNTAVALGVIDKAGSWFKYNGESIGQGATKAQAWLEENHAERITIEHAISAVMYEKDQET